MQICMQSSWITNRLDLYSVEQIDQAIHEECDCSELLRAAPRTLPVEYLDLFRLDHALIHRVE